MADEQPENTELEQIDLIDRKMGQVNGLLAIMINHETLCSVDTNHVTNALWGIQDMLLDIGRIQSNLINKP